MATQDIRVIAPEQLISAVLQLQYEHYRLVQIHATRLEEGFELSYSFDKDYAFVTIRVIIKPEDEIVSISAVYPPAFLYENEMKDLFGINVKLISIDYNGGLYRTAKKAPFNTPKGE